MSTSLVVLGLLADGPLHGYELQQRFKERGMASYTKLSFGSLYHALGRAEQSSFITREGVGRVGNRPERVVYRLTSAGREELERLMLGHLIEQEREYYSIDLALGLGDRLDPARLVAALKERAAGQRTRQLQLRARRRTINDEVRQKLEGRVPDLEWIMALTLSMIDHTIAHEAAETRWLVALITKLEGLLDPGVAPKED